MQLRVVRRDNEIVGVLPLVCSSHPRSRVVGYELLTVPDTQFGDFMCRSTEAEDVAEAVAADLGADDRWDVLRLDYLSSDGKCVDSLVNALRRHNLHVVERDGGRNFFINLENRWADYYRTRSRRLKKAINLASNRLRRSGSVTVEGFGVVGGRSDFEESTIDALIDISARSWKRDTGNTLDRPGPQAFIRTLSKHAFERNWLAIWILHIADKPVAMEYGLVFDRNVYALRGDFDSSCTKISPGAYLFRQLLEPLFGQGLKRYYMGRGANPYKVRWADESEPLRSLVVYNRTSGGRLEWVREEVIKLALRKTRDALQPAEDALMQRVFRNVLKAAPIIALVDQFATLPLLG